MKYIVSTFLALSPLSIAGAQPLLNSPWPKFRADMKQTGRSEVKPRLTDSAPWVFKTTKGIFSSPVIGTQGEIFIGSADRNFYALSAEGKVLWKVATGEIIDSSALLDTSGRLYFGSGDGILRGVDSHSGAVDWQFAAEQPSKTGGLINWFEGNVAIGTDGTLYAPNDNFRIYALDPETGAKDWHFPLNDQSWSSPAVDPATGNLYFGSNYIAPFEFLQPFYKNFFALNRDGKLLWRQSVQASVAASPLLSQAGLVVVGAFDGTLYAYDKTNGALRWSFKTQDHIYASASEQKDGTIIQASTDGYVYALNGTTGQLIWSFASGEPIRSSPAIDANGNIYYGSGDGALYVLNSNGTLRYRMQLIKEDRNDLNASPALSETSIILAGENGEIWSIPYDYCLRHKDERCSTAVNLPADGVTVSFVTPFGSSLKSAPSSIAGAESLTLAIHGTEKGRPVKAHFEEGQIKVESEPSLDITTRVSGDGKSLILTPKTTWPAGPVKLNLSLGYRHQNRSGIHYQEISFTTKDKTDFPEDEKLFVLRRLAVPIPTIMPSYNQIGFDSLSYVVRVLETNKGKGTAWVMAGLEDASGTVRVDPNSSANFALSWNSNAEGLFLDSNNGFSAASMNLNIPFKNFRLSLHSWDGKSAVFGALASTICNDIPTYGYFLKSLGFCSPKEGRLTLSGASEILVLPSEGQAKPATKVEWSSGKNWLNYATIEAKIEPSSAKLYSMVLVDTKTSLPIDAPYKNLVKSHSDRNKKLRLSLPYASGPSSVTSYLLENDQVIGTRVWLKNKSGVYK